MAFSRDVVIVGGCGHVGLPLGIAFADAGLVGDALRHQRRRPSTWCGPGKMPFLEPGADELLARLVGHRSARAPTTDPTSVSDGRARRRRHRHAGRRAPQPRPAGRARARSSALLAAPPRRPAPRAAQHRLPRGDRHGRAAAGRRSGSTIDVAFCPERIAEGKAMTELRALPQIVSARTDRGRARGPRTCSGTSPTTIVHLEPEEAELAKLFTNTWRYIKFAAANQFYMIANDFGLDFERIRAALAAATTRAPPTCPGAGLRRRPVPVQGHDAAGGVQQQQLHARPRQHDGQRGPPALPRRPARAALRPRRR